MQSAIKYVFLASVCLGVICLFGCNNANSKGGLQELDLTLPEMESATDDSDQEEEADVAVFVYVCGAVKDAGVYELGQGARVHEALKLAGGMTDEAATDYLNQARVIVDGERIYVPTLEEVKDGNVPEMEEGVSNNPATSDSAYKININTASQAELMRLSGIGEVKAKSIISYREKNGGFEQITDLMKVEGIKEGTFRKIEDDITVGN